MQYQTSQRISSYVFILSFLLVLSEKPLIQYYSYNNQKVNG